MMRINLLNLILVPLCAFALSGCSSPRPVNEVSDARADRIRQAAESSRAIPVQMLLTVGIPTDSSANRFVDTFPVVVYLFPQASESRLPVWSSGTFRFELRSGAGEVISVWEFSEANAEAARVSLAPGPGYSFFLRLAKGTDAALSGKGNLNGFFIHQSGLEASSNGVASVRLGTP